MLLFNINTNATKFQTVNAFHNIKLIVQKTRVQSEFKTSNYNV